MRVPSGTLKVRKMRNEYDANCQLATNLQLAENAKMKRINYIPPREPSKRLTMLVGVLTLMLAVAIGAMLAY